MAGIPHRPLTVRDYTPSHTGPWATYLNKETNVAHVVPGFGRRHVLALFCWCHPIFDTEYDHEDDVITHNVDQ